jgi:polyribonucleotide nucleotidyltransferase
MMRREKAIEMVQAITAEAEVGGIYRGTVRKIVEFGAFVEIMRAPRLAAHLADCQ